LRHDTTMECLYQSFINFDERVINILTADTKKRPKALFSSLNDCLTG
jgi:hypothetical protein